MHRSLGLPLTCRSILWPLVPRAVATCAALALGTACGSDPTAVQELNEDPVFVDRDGDGWAAPEDCVDEGYVWTRGDPTCEGGARVSFTPPDSLGIKDFSAVDDGGAMHLFYIENPGRIGVDDHETSFGHVSSRDLLQWEQHPSVSPPANPNSFYATAIWSPHVLRVEGIWYMFFTGVRIDGQIEQNRQRIGLMTSTDLMTWTLVENRCRGVDDPGCVLECGSALTAWGSSIPWGSDCRDAFVIPHEEGWLLLVTVRMPDGEQAVAIATSEDLLEWRIVDVIESTRGSIAESPALVVDRSQSQPIWRLFWTNRSGINHLSTGDPSRGAWGTRVFIREGFASELLPAGRDSYFFMTVQGARRIEFERLVFEDEWLHRTRSVLPRCRVPAAAIHPGADDPSDGIDNDCDGIVDGRAAPHGLELRIPLARF